MTKIWAIGNGESRIGFDLNEIVDHKIGCNAVARDFECNEYVAVDRRVVSELINLTTKPIYTRPDWSESFESYSNVRTLPNLPFTGPLRADEPFQWSSGPYAILLAALYQPKQVMLLGFDLWGNNKQINNVYKGTQNYNKISYRAVDPKYWIHQMSCLFNHFSNIEFIQLQNKDWMCPKEWLTLKNLTIKDISV